MPQEDAPLYSRGKYRLEWDRRRDGSLRTPFLQIVWYDDAAGRLRYRSTGTAEIGAAEDQLDLLYMERERGQTICPTCGRAYEAVSGHLVTQAIADYLLVRKARVSFDAIRPRLNHVLDFLAATSRAATTCDQVDDALVEEFREWSTERPVLVGKDKIEQLRAPGTIEASVRQLAAAINFAHRRRDTLHPAGFKVLPPSAVSRTPTFRASVAELAAMFRYCLDPQPPQGEVWSDKYRARMRSHRHALLRFLQISVATWCRPDAAHDFSTKAGRDQWIRSAGVIQLNPRGRRQTKKYRPAVPVPQRFARLVDTVDGHFVPVASVRKAFEGMRAELGLPGDRESGMKLVRRSMAQLARPRIGEANWTQGEIMLGHRKASTSDVYALFDPANLGLALAVTESIITEIEALVPGAFTGQTPELQLVKGGTAHA